MRRVRLSCTLLLCLVFSLCKLCAQTAPTASASAAGSTAATTSSAPVAVANPQTPEEFFARARQLSDLEASGIPFHLKATFVASGDAEFNGNGTYEEWWQSKDLWRKEATLEDYKYVAIKNGGDESDYASSFYSPLRLRQAMSFSLIHIPDGIDKSFQWKMQHETVGGVDFAVLSNVNDCGMAGKNLKCHAESYFTDDSVLRIRVNEVTEEVYNDIQAFQNLLIPHRITLTLDGDKILDISLTTLEPLSPNEIMLSKDAPVPAIPRMSPVKKFPTGSQVTASKLIHQVAPVYPVEAKLRGTEGMVVLAATIGTDGKVHDLDVVHSVGPLLDKAALEAVRGWRYRPTTIDGTPVVVETRVTVIFKLNH